MSLIIIVSSFSSLLLVSSSTACQQPSLPSDVYPLTKEKTSYGSSDVFDLVCIPGYKPETTYKLTCQDSNDWRGDFPDCKKSENQVRWWILLIAITMTLIAVPCIVPRIYFHFNDERHVQRKRLIQKAQEDDDYLNDILKDVDGGDKTGLVERDNMALSSPITTSTGYEFYNMTPQPLPSKKVYM